MIDIYNRLPTDQAYQIGLETSDEIEIILAQIKMVLGTKPGDIIGEPYFGVDINKYLFSMSYSQDEITQIIQNGILSNIEYDQNKYTISIYVDFGKDYEAGCDYACINIAINQIPCLGIIVNQ